MQGAKFMSEADTPRMTSDEKIDFIYKLFGKLLDKVDTLVTEVHELRIEVHELRTEVHELRARIEQLEAKVEQLEARVERLENKVEQLDARVAILENQEDARSKETRGKLEQIYLQLADLSQKTHDDVYHLDKQANYEHAKRIELQERLERLEKLVKDLIASNS